MTEALLQAMLSGLAVGGAYALVALGFSITFTTTKTLNFSHGEFVSAGAFIGMSALFLVLGLPRDLDDLRRRRCPAPARSCWHWPRRSASWALLGWLLYLHRRAPLRRAGRAWPGS